MKKAIAQKNNIWRAVLLAAITLMMALVPMLISSGYVLNVCINALIFTVLAMSLNVIYGYAGLLSFAQVGFWGLGGYAAALMATKLGWSPWLGMAVAPFVCAPLAAALAAVALRLSNHAFVIVSIAFTLLLQMLSQEWIALTNGPMGIPGLPAPAVGFGADAIVLNTPRLYYYLALLFFLASIAMMYLVLSSQIGHTLRLIKHDEMLARSFGIRVTWWKLFAAGFSAAFAGLAGAISVFFVSIVDPLIFDAYYTQIILVIVIVGGLGSFWPVVVAGFILTALPELLRVPSELRMINYGLVLMAAVLLFPQGLAGAFAYRVRKIATPREAKPEASS